ncbi:MAG: CapA family protein, partial [Candidatus Kerfeldbacteria bacterium]|nr:CapA family protein [Candidatus Kerfeldbacteria bacterium]
MPIGYSRVLLFVSGLLVVTGLVVWFSIISRSTDATTHTIAQISFLAVGDIMLSRNVAAKIKKANDPLLPFRKLDDLLAGVDFNFGNLESPFSGSDKFNPSPTLVF